MQSLSSERRKHRVITSAGVRDAGKIFLFRSQ
jgi:hypothetical protein